MNRLASAFKSFLACRMARNMEIRARRFRRSLRDEHREAMRLLCNTDRRVRGLRLYAAWSGPRRVIFARRPMLLLAHSPLSRSSLDERPCIEGLPYSLDERPATGVRVRAEFIEQNVLIDLNEVTSIESGSISILIEGMNLIAARGGNLAIFGVREEVARVLKTARLDQVFRIFSTREEALAGRF